MTLRPILALGALTVLSACPLDPKNIGEPGPDSSTTDSTAAEPSTTDLVTSGEDPSTAPATDTDTDADTGEPPVACNEVAPGVSADFTFDVAAWPAADDSFFDYEGPCTVDAVDVAAGTVTTTLTCDVDGTPLVGSFAIPESPTGAVDWAPGLAVDLRIHTEEEIGLQNNDVRMTLAGDPLALLVDGSDWSGDNVPTLPYMIGPILRELSETCVVDEDEFFELTYSLAAGASVSLPSGTRGDLAIDAAAAYAIDVAYAGEGCCHGGEHILIRRVKLP